MFILAEKASVAADFADTLGAKKFSGFFAGGGTVITYCRGHLFDLCEPAFYDPKYKKWNVEDLPIIPQKFCYTKKEGAFNQADVVMRLLREHADDEIIIATDADREGELIARIVLDQAGITDTGRCRRFWVSEALTPEVIRKGLAEARPLSDYDMLAAQGYARSHTDWLIGMNFSRFVSAGNDEKFPVGRVQTAVLFEIARRNSEVRNFVPQPYEELEAVIRDGNGVEVRALLIDGDTQKTGFPAGSEYVKKAADICRGSKIQSASEDTALRTVRPERLLNINALEKEAYKRFGYSPEKTLGIAETLYNDCKCLSYPRTPSRAVGDNGVEMFRSKFDLLKSAYPEISGFCDEALIAPTNRHIFNSADVESHPALIPLAALPGTASREQRDVFGIVVESFFRVCMDDWKYNEKKIIFETGGFRFRTVLRETVQDGWRAYERRNLTAAQNGGKNDKDEPQEVPGFDSGNCSIVALNRLSKKTQPKKDYSIDTLLTFMEKPRGETAEKLVGLGTPATRAETIQKLFKSGYVVEDGKRLTATKKGLWLLSFLAKDRQLAKIANVSQTTYWENELAANPAEFERHIREYVTQSINPGIKESYVKDSPGSCPLCGNAVVETKLSWSCSAWNKSPACKFTVWKQQHGAALAFDDIKLMLSGKSSRVKNCKNREGRPYRASFKLDVDGKTVQTFADPAKTPKGGVRGRGRRKITAS